MHQATFIRFFLAYALVMGMAAFSASAQDRPAGAYNSNPILATVDGKPITLEDIRNKPLYDMTAKLYEAMNAMLMQEAVKRLAASHPEIKASANKKVSDKEAQEFYNKNNLKERGPFDKLKPAIQEHLKQQADFENMKKQYEIAVKKGWVKSYMTEPKEMLVEASLGAAFIRGNENGKVMLLEFSDYQCPFCGRVQGTLSNIYQKFSKQVAFAYKHFPLSFHSEADEASMAVECAREQEKFIEMHSILYKNQKAQKVDDLKKYARDIKIGNLSKFDQCLTSEKYRTLVNANIDEGASLGISGTPGFIIGVYDAKSKKVRGEVVSGALPQENFDEILQKYLKR